MAVSNANRTHCVTFNDGADKLYAVKSREYGDPIPMGVSKPEIRCAMSETDASRMADFLRRNSVFFTNVKVRRLNIK